MKILIIQTAFIGDVVLATPLIEKIKQKYPNSAIDFLLREGNESLLFNHPYLNEVIVFNKKHHKYLNLFHLMKLVRSRRYDYVINVQRFFTTGLITVMSGARITIGFDKNPLSFLFTHSAKHEIVRNNLHNHEVSRNLSLLKHVTDTEFIRPRLYPSGNDYESVATSDQYICIAPASVWFTKQLPEHKWCELIDQLPSSFKIYLLGSASDRELCEEIRRNTDSDRVEIKAGELTFLQSAELIKNAKMTFANDSAPVHLASAMNAPITVIYCSTIPEFGFGPLSDNSHTIEVDEILACRPCNLHGYRNCPEKHFRCSDISIDSIILKSGLLSNC